MKIMKITLLAALTLAAVFAVNLRAQDSTNLPSAAVTNQPPVRRAGIDVTKSLNLTPDQRTTFMQILGAQRQQIAAVNTNALLSANEKKGKIKAILDANDAQLQKVLTPEQLQKYQSMQVFIRRMGTPPPRPPMSPGMSGTNAPAAARP